MLSAAVSAGRLTPISLGPTCTAAEMLEMLGLRQAAFPFDWIVSSLAMVEHCLDDAFRTFLDPQFHQRINKRRSDHSFYRDEFGLRAVFHHHPMPAKLEHFERAVQRFQETPCPVFIYMAEVNQPDPVVLKRVRSKLRGPLLAYVLLEPGVPDPGRSDLTVVRLRSKWTHDTFPVEAEEIGLSSRLTADLLEFAPAGVSLDA